MRIHGPICLAMPARSKQSHVKAWAEMLGIATNLGSLGRSLRLLPLFWRQKWIVLLGQFHHRLGRRCHIWHSFPWDVRLEPPNQHRCDERVVLSLCQLPPFEHWYQKTKGSNYPSKIDLYFSWLPPRVALRTHLFAKDATMGGGEKTMAASLRPCKRFVLWTWSKNHAYNGDIE